jgi:hypothetical protein
MFGTLGQPYLDSTCLTFLALHGYIPQLPSTNPDRGASESSRVAQTYSLETGLVEWPLTAGIGPISLRTPRLSSWEPMTPKKFELMALDRSLIGREVPGNDNERLGRIIEPEMAAVVVSPQGFVFYWDGSRSVLVSDVGRLADSPQPLTGYKSESQWSKYSLDRGHVQGPGHGGVARDEAGVGNGVTPILVHPGQLYFDSIAEFGMMMGSPIDESHNDCCGKYTPAAAAFVQDQFGVDASHIDWQAADKERHINGSFSHTAPFDPASACAALRHAVTQQAAPAAVSAAFTRTATTRPQRSPTQRPAR